MKVECVECLFVFDADPKRLRMEQDAYIYDGQYEWFAILRTYCPNCDCERVIDVLDDDYEFVVKEDMQ